MFSRFSPAASAQAEAGNQPANPNQQPAQVPALLAAQLAQVPAQLATLQAGQAGMQAQLAGMQAQLSNQRRRALNAHAHAMHPQPGVVQLAPLAKEQLPPAGAAAPGAFPPAGAFPHTWADVQQVGAGRDVVRARLSGGSRHHLLMLVSSNRHLSPLPVVSFMQLNNAQLTTLANFYGENFGQPGGACL